MPSGKFHDKISIIAIPIVLGIVYYFTQDILNIILLVGSFIFSSFMFNGDLDTISLPYQRWGILKFIWIPYQFMFRHRSFYTHGIIVGTLIRLIYIGIIPISIIWFYYNIEIINLIDWNYLVPIFIGLELGSSLHTISDYLI